MRRACLFLILAGVLIASPAVADTVYLANGSVLNGRVESLGAEELVLDSDYAGTLHIQRQAVSGIDTSETIQITRAEGAATTGRLAYDPETGQQMLIVDGVARPLALDAGVTLARADAEAGMPAAQAVAATAADAAPAETEAPDLWSGEFQLGLNGNSGNTETQSLLVGVAALRDTGDNRLSLSAQVDRQKEDGVLTANEMIGEAKLEQDLTPRLFVFVKQELEQDEFENIDLRSRTIVGPGYFLVREERVTFKIRGGVGYEYEEYIDGSSDAGAILALGWDYWQLFGDWLELTHEFNFYPEVSDSPSENFTLESVLGAQLPIADSPVWSVSAELAHEYSNNPPPGVEELDTSYVLGVVREFD